MLSVTAPDNLHEPGWATPVCGCCWTGVPHERLALCLHVEQTQHDDAGWCAGPTALHCPVACHAVPCCAQDGDGRQCSSAGPDHRSHLCRLQRHAADPVRHDTAAAQAAEPPAAGQHGAGAGRDAAAVGALGRQGGQWALGQPLHADDAGAGLPAAVVPDISGRQHQPVHVPGAVQRGHLPGRLALWLPARRNRSSSNASSGSSAVRRRIFTHLCAVALQLP